MAYKEFPTNSCLHIISGIVLADGILNHNNIIRSVLLLLPLYFIASQAETEMI